LNIDYKQNKNNERTTRVWQNGGRSSKFEHSYFYQHLWFIEHLCFDFPHFAKPQNVISNPLTTVQTLTDSAKMDDREIFGQAVWLSFAKAKEKQPDTQANSSCFTFAFAHRTRKPTAIVTFD
jgi:hypothetical protein